MIDDVEAFRAAWNAAHAIEAGPKPSAPIQRALDLLGQGVLSRVVRGSTVDAALKPFLAAVNSGGSTSDPGSLGAAVFRDGDRWLVDSRMGYASSLSAFDRKGKRLSLPADLRWSYRYFGPVLRTGALLAFDGLSLSDAGIRYDYRFHWLRRTPQGYVSAGLAKGTWTYGDDTQAHLIASSDRVTLASLDEPKSFFVSNAVLALRRKETWTVGRTSAKRTKLILEDGDLRAADLWLGRHCGEKLTPSWTVAKENGMLDDIRRGKGFLELNLEGIWLHFNLVPRGGKLVVRNVTVKP